MTREEKQKAIDALKISAPVMAVTQEEFNDYIQTLNKVMDWLEQEPTIRNCFGCKYSKDNHNADTEECHLCMWENQYTPTAKNDLGVDCISRSRAIERLKLNFPISQGADNSRDRHRYMQAMADIQAIRELPSVTPQESKTGHWLMPDKGYSSKIWRKCSCCGTHIEKYTKYISFDDEVHYIPYRLNYCYVCGAKMVEPQESEVNNG